MASPRPRTLLGLRHTNRQAVARGPQHILPARNSAGGLCRLRMEDRDRSSEPPRRVSRSAAPPALLSETFCLVRSFASCASNAHVLKDFVEPLYCNRLVQKLFKIAPPCQPQTRSAMMISRQVQDRLGCFLAFSRSEHHTTARVPHQGCYFAPFRTDEHDRSADRHDAIDLARDAESLHFGPQGHEVNVSCGQAVAQVFLGLVADKSDVLQPLPAHPVFQPAFPLPLTNEQNAQLGRRRETAYHGDQRLGLMDYAEIARIHDHCLRLHVLLFPEPILLRRNRS